MLGLWGYLTHKSALWGAFLLLPFFATLLLCYFARRRGLLRPRAIATQRHWPSASICGTHSGGNLETRASAQTSKFLVPCICVPRASGSMGGDSPRAQQAACIGLRFNTQMVTVWLRWLRFELRQQPGSDQNSGRLLPEAHPASTKFLLRLRLPPPAHVPSTTK